jgi:hypothetical protein
MGLSPELYVMLHRTLYPNFGRIAGTAEGMALLSVIALTWRVRRTLVLFRATLSSAILLVLSHVVFWVFVYRANTTMAAWPLDQIPADWTSWRDRWEYAHATRAGLTLVALSLLVTSLQRKSAKAGD